MKVKILFYLMTFLIGLSFPINAGEQTKDPWGIEGKIAFGTSRGEHPYGIAIYEKGKIARVSENGNSPLWSPSGNKLLYAVGGEDLEILNMQTGEVEKFTVPVYTNERRWMPNETEILVSGYDRSKGQNAVRNLYLLNIETGAWQQLTFFNNKETFFDFDVFKDGKRILCSFTPNPDDKKDRGIYVMDLDSGEMKKLKDYGGDVKLMPGEKSFVMNKAIRKGDKLISPMEVFLVDIETGKETQLTKTGTWKHQPTVSPDGKTILYSAFVQGTERIFKLDIATKKQREIFDRKPGYAGKIPHDRNPDWHA